MDIKEINEQTKNAFDFIQKLYLETSFLIKEIEGLLSEQEEKFLIVRPSGYQVVASSSNGLDPNLVSYWFYKKLSVFFVPSSMIRLVKGQTETKFSENLKILVYRFVFIDNEIDEPSIFYGFLKNINKTNPEKEMPSKFEHAVSSVEAKLPIKTGRFDYKDSNIKFDIDLARANLFSINTSEEIVSRLIKPSIIKFNGE